MARKMLYQVILSGNNVQNNALPCHTDLGIMFRIILFHVVRTGSKVQNDAISGHNDWE